MIEKGMDPGPANPDPFGGLLSRAPRRPEQSLYRGLGMLAAGVGLLTPSIVIRWSGATVSPDSADFVLFLAVIGPVVALFGLANVVYYGLTKNRPPEAASPRSQDSRSGS